MRGIGSIITSMVVIGGWFALAVGADLVDLHGTVYNNNNNKVSGVIVRLTEANMADTTGADGKYHIVGEISAIRDGMNAKSVYSKLHVSDKWIRFGIDRSSVHVSIQAFDMTGRKLSYGFARELSKGNYKLGIGTIFQDAAHSVYLLRGQVGEREFVEKVYHGATNHAPRGLLCTYSAQPAGLAKAVQPGIVDTVTYSKMGQLITSRAISQYRDTLADLFIFQREVSGAVSGAPIEIGRMQAVLSGYGIPAYETPHAPLQYFPSSRQFSGYIYTVFTQQSAEYCVYVQAYDTLDRVIGRSQEVSFGNIAGNIPIPTFDPTNALPVIDVSDTSVGINDDVILSTTVTDTFGGTIATYAWKCGDAEWFVVGDDDTTVTAPATAQTWICSLKVEDDDSNIVYNTIAVTVETRAPTADAGNDTTVGIYDAVNLKGSGSIDETEIVAFAWKCGSGEWQGDGDGDTVVTAPVTAQTWVCSLKVEDDDGNIRYDAMTVTVETRAPTVVTRDTAVFVGEQVHLRGSASYDETQIDEFAWKVGAGNWVASATGNTTITTPATEQTLLCSLRVTDDDGNRSYGQVSIAVIDTTVEDADGNTYTVTIVGNQVWTVENLRTTKYNDSTDIPHVPDSSTWANLSTPGYCFYNNSTAPAEQEKWGALYNWYVVAPSHSHQLAPEGWRVPTDADWDTLQKYLIANGYNWDGSTSGNKIGKSLAAQTDWDSSSSCEEGDVGYNKSSNNSTGFSALPGGYRDDDDGNFSYQSYFGGWWSATENAYFRNLSNSTGSLYRLTYGKPFGFSVRLVRDVD